MLEAVILLMACLITFVILKQIKSHIKIFLLVTLGYITIKDLKYVKADSGNPLYLIFSKVSVCLRLVSTNDSKEKIKKILRILEKN